MMRNIFRKYEILLLIILVFIDQIVKIFIDRSLEIGGVLSTNFLFEITKFYNTGVSFSLFSGYIILIIVLTILAFGLLIWIKKDYESKIVNIGIILIMAGAIGNFLDRIMYGHVIDYIKITFANIHFPIFNIADMLITFGFIVIILYEVIQTFSKKKG